MSEIMTTEQAALSVGLPLAGASPALQILLNDQLYERCKQVAKIMANGQGYTPKHLLQQTEACFAVVTRSITWKLDPFAVCLATYQTPGGQIGYFGTLCQAILENSGKLDGPVTFEHFGDWDGILGKFKIQTSAKGKQYPVASYGMEEEEGLGVTVRASVHGEAEPREWSMLLKQAWPRNSTLWATDPKSQLCYTAVRRFANLAAPGLFMGVPFDREAEAEYGPEHARDITPAERPARAAQRPQELPPMDSASDDAEDDEAGQEATEAAEDMDEAFKQTVGPADRTESAAGVPRPDADSAPAAASALSAGGPSPETDPPGGDDGESAGVPPAPAGELVLAPEGEGAPEPASHPAAYLSWFRKQLRGCENRAHIVELWGNEVTFVAKLPKGMAAQCRSELEQRRGQLAA